jgi:hypothetical protein
VRNTLDRALEKVREANVPKQPGERGRRPAVTLTWIEAGALADYVEWLKRQLGGVRGRMARLSRRSR